MTGSQHTAVLGDSTPTSLGGRAVPVPGPVLILPAEAEHCTLSRDQVISEIPGEVLMAPSGRARGLVYMPKLTYANASAKLEAVLDSHPDIRWIQLPMAGVDFYSDLMKKPNMRDRIWTSGKGAFSQPVAEHALTMTLALLRRIPQRVTATSWGGNAGQSLFGANVLLVGMGGISQALISLLAPFRCNITVLRRATVASDGGPVRMLPTSELHNELPRADVVVLAPALTAETLGLIGKEELALMRKSAVLVNVGRGQLIDTDALCDTIENSGIAGVGLDVTDPEPLPIDHRFWNIMHTANRPDHEFDDSGNPRTQVILTPHTADTPQMVDPLLRERIQLNARAFFAQDGKFIGLVDTDKGY